MKTVKKASCLQPNQSVSSLQPGITGSLVGLALGTFLLAQPALAAVTVQTWWHLGEVADYYQDSANSRRLGSAYSHIPWNNPAYGGNFNGIITPTGVGGALGTSGYTSTQSLRSGAWGTMICTMWDAAGYQPPTDNYFIEIWVQPHGKGYVYGTSGAWILRAGGFGLRVKDNGDDTSSYVGTASGVDVGTPVLINTNAWTHLALVRDNGVSTYYVNGSASGPSDSSSLGTGGVQFGADNAGYDGLMDEARICTFDVGTFTTNYFLLRPPGPQILTQPQNAVVWNGGSAPFAVGAVIDPAVTYQWQRAGTNLTGETAASLYLPQVALADSGSQFSSILTATSISVTSSPAANLSVLPNRTTDVSFYRAAVTGEASLAAYFTADDCLGTTLTNVVDVTRNGTLEGTVTYDGRTNRAFGQRAVWLKGDGDVQIPNNPAFEFSGGNGTVEALVYPESGGRQDGTIFAWAQDGGTVGYALMASRDGSQFIYSNDAPALLTWPAPANLNGRLSHVALVIENNTNVTLILDGQSLGTKQQTGLGFAGGAPAWIGSLGTALRRFNGAIDEVSVYGSALSLNTIQVHYSRYVYGTNVSAPSIVSQPGSRTVLAGAAPILQVQVGGTLPINYQWASNGVPIPGATSTKHTVVSSLGAPTATYELWATNAIGWTNTQPIVLTFAAPSAGYASAVLNDHPSSYWRFAESSGTVAVDSAGYNDATYSGALTLGVPGRFAADPDTAVQFTGGNAPVPYTPTLNPATAFSLECFVNPSQSGQVQRAIVGAQNRNVGRSGYGFYQGFNGNFWESHLGDGTTVTMFLQGTSPVNAGEWYHVVLVYDPSDTNANGRLYVNGFQEATGSGNFLPNNQQPFTIAGRQGLGNYLATIDELAFYNYALSANQVSNHWSYSWTPSSITQQPVGVTNTEWSSVSLTVAASGYPNTYQWYKVGTGALTDVDNFDGTRHYPNGVTNTTLTISQSHPADSGQYYVVVNNALGGSQSQNATVLINAETTPPTVAVASALSTPKPSSPTPSPYLVRITFSEVIDVVSGGTLGNYSINGGASISSVLVTTDSRSVVLATAGLTPGQKYTLLISGVKDQAQAPNTIVASTPADVWAPVISQGAVWDFYASIINTPNDVANLTGSLYYPNGPYTNINTTTFDSTPITGGNLTGKPAFGALGDNYGSSLSAWLTPTVTTNYYFFLASDDASELHLSGDANPANALLIAGSTGNGAFVEPGNAATSGAIPLTAGVSYFIRALQVEGGGGDFVKVAWKMEGDPAAANTLLPISGSVLSAYAPLPAPQFGSPQFNSGSGQLTISWTGVGTLYQSTNLVNWIPVPGNPSNPYVVNVGSAPQLFYRVVRQ